MYSAGRFFTMTGWHLDETPGTVEPRQSPLSALHTAVFGAPTPPQPPGRRAPSPTLDDATLLSKARSARNSAKFIRLWAGDTSMHGGDDSVADMALCAELAFWTHDPAQIDRLFRQSGLMRPKWDAIHNTQTHETYGTRTIANTLTRQRSQYGTPAAAGLHGFSTLTTQLSRGLTSTLRRAL
jgi:primase-polymerase (primpol)-like protein